jgi:hypothetical protein
MQSFKRPFENVSSKNTSYSQFNQKTPLLNKSPPWTQQRQEKPPAFTQNRPKCLFPTPRTNGNPYIGPTGPTAKAGGAADGLMPAHTTTNKKLKAS